MTKEGGNERGEFIMKGGEKPEKRMRMGRLKNERERQKGMT